MTTTESGHTPYYVNTAGVTICEQCGKPWDDAHPTESDAVRYVRAMTSAELTDLLDADLRRATGRCVSPPILRAARAEQEARRG